MRPVLDAFPDFADNPRSPGRNGIPVLFPFPNRVNLGRFSFQGKTYELPITNGPNAIHGFAISAPWDVVSHGDDRGEAAITGRFQISKHAPDMLKRWPADAILQIRYGLAGRRLTLSAVITNPTADDLPYGLGFHPYFRLPFEKGGDLEKTRVVVPAPEYWVLDKFVPTGEKKPVDDRLDFRNGKPMKGLKLDDVLTGLVYNEGGYACRLEDLALKAELRMTTDPMIREFVLYTPPGDGDVIAIEPYTQTTDAINLASREIDGGLRVLGHGMHENVTIVFETIG